MLSKEYKKDYKNSYLIITPKKDWLALNLGEVLRYKDLLWLFVPRIFLFNYSGMFITPWYDY